MNIFDDESKAVKQLQKDKHTLLEGYITENLFHKQFILNSKQESTHGWWTANHNGIRFFFVVKETLNQLDNHIIQVVSQDSITYQVYLSGDRFLFTKDGKVIELNNFISRHSLTADRKGLLASESTRNKSRQTNAIEYFKKEDLLSKIAIERLFANEILTIYFSSMVNIDLFTRKNNLINVIEIKYKFESKDNHFGLNTGQLGIFKYFHRKGFTIFHFILYNHTKDLDLSIVNFVKLQDKKYWYFGIIDPSIFLESGIAPELTSIDGKFKQRYFKIPLSHFKDHKIQLIV